MRFSVVIPLYNKELYVEKAIRSVLTQTYNDYELIVINDGSSDNSLLVAKTVLHGTDAIIVNQNNSGVSAARNVGISIARGEFICFLDADDWWKDDFLERMDYLINKYPNAGIYGVNYYYYKDKRCEQRISIPSGYFNYFKEYADIMQMPLTSISVAVPRGTLLDIGGFDESLSLGEDFDLWIRIALKYRTCFLNQPLAYYNQDVDTGSRGTGCLVHPSKHILWNLERYKIVEDSNLDFKRLVDNLRVYCAMPYFISKPYHKCAVELLAHVDWSRQPLSSKRNYDKPIAVLVLKDRIMRFGSRVKHKLMWIFTL